MSVGRKVDIDLEVTRADVVHMICLDIVAPPRGESNACLSCWDVCYVEILPIWIVGVGINEGIVEGFSCTLGGVEIECEDIVRDASKGVSTICWGSEVARPDLPVICAVRIALLQLTADSFFLGSF